MKANFQTGIKICSKCKVPKKLLFFTTDSKKSDGFDAYCKDCRKILAKASYIFTSKSKKFISFSDIKNQKISKFNYQLQIVWNNLTLSN